MNKVGFTGTRVNITKEQTKAFKKLIKSFNMIEFHHGDCVGWDAEAHKTIKKMKLPHHVEIVIHPPHYNGYRAYCKGHLVLPTKPYLDRNKDIVDQSDMLIACPAGKEKLSSGTWSTVRYARKKDKPVYIILPNGKVKKENV